MEFPTPTAEDVLSRADRTNPRSALSSIVVAKRILEKEGKLDQLPSLCDQFSIPLDGTCQNASNAYTRDANNATNDEEKERHLLAAQKALEVANLG